MSNLLHLEKSPYLLQHQNNPFWWRPWVRGVSGCARREKAGVSFDRLLDLHWCHVMAHESFEDVEVADVLNKNFVCIKVDREEHPMWTRCTWRHCRRFQVVAAGRCRCGSLLTVNVFCGNYFPKPRFLQLLARIQEIWSTEPDKLTADSERLLDSVRSMGELEAREDLQFKYQEFLESLHHTLQHHFDMVHGGFGGAPNFRRR